MNQDQIIVEIAKFPGWEWDEDQGRLATAMEFEDFPQAINFIEAIAELAQELEVYPEIFLHQERFVQLMVGEEEISAEHFEFIAALEEMIATAAEMEAESD